MFVGIAAFLFVTLVVMAWRVRLTRSTEQAYDSYRHALVALRRSPSDAEMRLRALDAGLACSRLMRGRYFAPRIDETDVRVDIELATGEPHGLARGSVEDRLRDLRRLVDSRLITEADYEARKQEILREV